MIPISQFIRRPSSRTHKTQLPECSRCRLSIAHPVLEKDAGELIVQCVAGDAINLRKRALLDPMTILMLEEIDP
jgi:hypothetical protein